ncbi:hypothetical protein ACQEV4_40495 [Streptomyces shenzhenensis]|uniref:hypothetical protein n=1 Tax=Streptomyces shenzhenensis TaxID=943815 RepID=UPI003D9010EF
MSQYTDGFTVTEMSAAAGAYDDSSGTLDLSIVATNIGDPAKADAVVRAALDAAYAALATEFPAETTYKTDVRAIGGKSL